MSVLPIVRTRPLHRTDQRSRRPRTWVAVAAAAALLVALVGCGSSDATADPTSSSVGAGATTGPNGGATDNAVTVTTPGMSFKVSGALRPGVATITLENTDDVTHMMGIARMKKGVTLDQMKTALAKDGEDASAKLLADNPPPALGTPAPVGPGQSSTVTAPDLKAGTYALICFLADDSGKPHFTMGMIGELEVRGEKATDKPSSDGTITIDDKAITVPDGFTGKGTFVVKNTGKKGHNISFARLDTGATLDSYFGAVGGAMGSNKSIDSAKGGVLVGGVDELDPGQSAYLTLDLPTGKHYAYLSTDEQDAGPGLPPQHGEFSN